MARINMNGVVGGGLAAGLIINISEYILNEPVLGADMRAALTERNLPEIGGSAIAAFVVFGFLFGLVMIWLYAAIRPRFGPGPKTAVIAGVVTWFLAYLSPSVGFVVMGFFPTNLIVFSVVWGLAELIVAALVGGKLYTEA